MAAILNSLAPTYLLPSPSPRGGGGGDRDGGAVFDLPSALSAEVRDRRRKCALARGYLTPHPNPGHCWLVVPTELAPRIRAMLKSLAIHAVHNSCLRMPTHFPRSAVLQLNLKPSERELGQATFGPVSRR